MNQSKIEIISIRNFGNLELISFQPDILAIKPGQFLIVYHPEKDDHVVPIYFISGLQKNFFEKPSDSSWEIGDQLITKGPIGTGFSDKVRFQNLFCISFGKSKGGLNPILETSVKKGKNVAYMMDEMSLFLPNSIEIVFSNTIEETLHWADRVLIDVERDQLENNLDTLKWIMNLKIPAEILIYCPILCSGTSQCSVCSINTKKGGVRTCQQGTVFNLYELEF